MSHQLLRNGNGEWGGGWGGRGVGRVTLKADVGGGVLCPGIL